MRALLAMDHDALGYLQRQVGRRQPKFGEHAGENTDLRQAIKILSEFNQEGALDNVPFDSVWNMINAVAKSAG